MVSTPGSTPYFSYLVFAGLKYCTPFYAQDFLPGGLCKWWALPVLPRTSVMRLCGIEVLYPFLCTRFPPGWWAPPILPLDFPKILFFPGCLCHFKVLFIPVWRNSPVENSTGDVRTNWPKGEWVIFDATPDTAYVNHFVFLREFIMWFKSIQAKLVDLATLSLAFKYMWETDL